MDLTKYIKVTAPEGQTPVVLLATMRDYFVSSGFKVEEPTEEEVLKHFPELALKQKPEAVKAEEQAEAVEAEEQAEAVEEAQ